MNHFRQNFPFYSCLIQADTFFDQRTLISLENSRSMTCILFDLQQFESELNNPGREKDVLHYLHDKEQDYLKRLTSKKRKREFWAE